MPQKTEEISIIFRVQFDNAQGADGFRILNGTFLRLLVKIWKSGSNKGQVGVEEDEKPSVSL